MVRCRISLLRHRCGKFFNSGMLYGLDTSVAYNSLLVRIEAYPFYDSHVIPALLDADCCGKTLRLEQKHDTVEAYNQDIQLSWRTARL